jgi:hypothetical protein
MWLSCFNAGKLKAILFSRKGRLAKPDNRGVVEQHLF